MNNDALATWVVFTIRTLGVREVFDTLGVKLFYADLLKEKVWGLYSDQKRAVWVERTLDERQRQATLTHECVHALLRHDGRQHMVTEWVVGEITARVLIDPKRYQQAASAGANSQQIARALGVEPHLIAPFRDWLEQGSIANRCSDSAGIVRELLRRRRMSQAQLSQRTGIAASTLSRRLIDGPSFLVNELAAIAHVFDVRTADLLPIGEPVRARAVKSGQGL